MKADGDERRSPRKGKARPNASLTTPSDAASPPRPKDPVRQFCILFSFVWIVLLLLVGAYAQGAGIGIGALEVLLLLCLIFVPLFAIWGPYVLIKRQIDDFFTLQDDRVQKELMQINKSIGDLTKAQIHLAQNAMGLELAQPKEVNGNGTAQRREKIAVAELDHPQLPLDDDASAEIEITLSDLAHVLNFSDRKERGDWANAFARVRDQGQYVGFIRTAEQLLEIFESEGIYVEDLSIRPATPQIWRRFLSGERDSEILTMAGVQDPSVLALVRARIRNDNAAQEISLRYQKRFLEIMETLAESSPDEDLIVLNRSRGGRLFAILGNISGTFGKVRVKK